MDDSIIEVYITMLSKNINWGTESRVFEARWILSTLGVPMTVEIMEDNEWKKFSKWTGE